MSYVVDAGLFNWDCSALVTEVTTACTELLFYGIHVVLFVLAMYILARRRTAGKKVLLIHTVVMALFGTTQVVIGVIEVVVAVRTVQVDVQGGIPYQLSTASRTLNIVQSVIFWLNNLVSDSLLLYRCFMIWGSRWPPVVLPGILIVATCVEGCVWYGFNDGLGEVARVPFLLAAVTNLHQQISATLISKDQRVEFDLRGASHHQDDTSWYTPGTALLPAHYRSNLSPERVSADDFRQVGRFSLPSAPIASYHSHLDVLTKPINTK
ncbi:hypothetical protein C8F04DRAFT_1306994 [Mycena alexandri]|uniref:Uncharacterized protein n=1 Tax=Mycena alexandri TaxID=1745969 RepID=A0AAD6WRU5_9AGAR|nr:hypothetical protein C8F04DRAFT_1306994 [Mycena alexandri]